MCVRKTEGTTDKNVELVDWKNKAELDYSPLDTRLSRTSYIQYELGTRVAESWNTDVR